MNNKINRYTQAVYHSDKYHVEEKLIVSDLPFKQKWEVKDIKKDKTIIMVDKPKLDDESLEWHFNNLPDNI